MHQLVDTAVDALDAYQELPLNLLGYCSGTFTMIKIARQLVATGRPAPVRLFICSAAEPRHIERDRPAHAMSDDRLKHYLRVRQVTPEAVLSDRALFDLFAPTLRADFKLFETAEFEVTPVLDIPITAIMGNDDRTIRLDALLDWRHHTGRTFSIHLLPCGHDIFSPENIGAVVKILTSDMIG